MDPKRPTTTYWIPVRRGSVAEDRSHAQDAPCRCLWKCLGTATCQEAWALRGFGHEAQAKLSFLSRSWTVSDSLGCSLPLRMPFLCVAFIVFFSQSTKKTPSMTYTPPLGPNRMGLHSPRPNGSMLHHRPAMPHAAAMPHARARDGARCVTARISGL